MADRSKSADALHAYDRLAEECLRRCDVIASLTETDGQITRRFLTPPARLVHDELRAWMTQLRMSVRIDDAGNLIGTRAGDANATQTLLTGSHLDTVPNGGKYDGALGVVIALAVVQALGTTELPFHLDVIGFSEEEGVRFATPYLGSHAVAGTFDDAWLDRLDASKQTMRSAMETFGLHPDQIGLAAYDPTRIVGYVEAHIEQGPVLATANQPLGVVDFIAGQSRLCISFRGQSGHAGTTPMHPRRDALVVAARWIAGVSDLARSIEGLRATVGYASVFPNARNVIPEYVELSLDVRHRSDATRTAATCDLRALAHDLASQSDAVFTVLEEQTQRAAAMDPKLTHQLSDSISACGYPSLTMLSGAGHDATVVAERFPTALLFIRQRSGTSHHPDEDVELDDVAVAIEVLQHFIRSLAADGRNAQ